MNNQEFANQVAIVTGAGQGIGFEICRELITCGASIVLNDVNEELTAKAAASLNKEFPGKCLGMAGDAADFNFIQEMISGAVSAYGKLTIAIANAGITLFGNFLEYEPVALQQVLKVNMGGTFFLAQAAAKQMIKQQTGGSLLFMSSVTGHQAHKDLAAYSMTKAGIEMLARNLVIELSEHKINVNTVAPGAALTERTVEDQTYEKTWSKLTPLGRPCTTQDIAQAALFLVSEKARQVTGQTLVIDGGWTAISPSPYE